MTFRVLVAPDKFKGSLTAPEVARAMARGISFVMSAEITGCPVADGGEGTIDALVAAGWTRRHAVTRRPVPTAARTRTASDDTVEAHWSASDTKAVIEAAQANGLHLLPFGPSPATALCASTAGVGDLVLAVIDAGYRDITITVGGSASSDGGAGLLTALGARILDAHGEELPGGGAALARVERVDLSAALIRLDGVRLTVACDVDNPLTGPEGAAAVYSPQKGADAGAVKLLETGLTRWLSVLSHTVGHAVDGPGAGAGGGVVAGLLAVGARVVSGAEFVIDALDLNRALQSADLLITGEGSLDGQSLRGKVVAALAKSAVRAGCPAYVIAGRASLSRRELHDARIAGLQTLVGLAPSPELAMAEAAHWVTVAAERIARSYLTDPAHASARSYERHPAGGRRPDRASSGRHDS